MPPPDITRAAVRIDVLIAVYNAAPFIRETLDCVRAQEWPAHRIFVIDDGSTDGSGEILDAEPGIELLRHPNRANRGQAACLRLALERADGTHVAILDADDYWYPEKLKRHAEVMAADPSLALTYSDGWVVDTNRRKLWPLVTPGHVEPHDVDRLLLDCYIRNPTSVLVRRDALLAAGGLESGLVPWDHDLWLRIAERYPIDYLPERLCEYRQHAGQLSRSRRQWEDGARVLAAARARHAYRRSTIRRRRAVLAFRLGQHDWHHGRKARGLANFAVAALFDPARAVRTVLGGDPVNA